MHVRLPVLDDAGRPALHPRSVDLERADHEHVVLFPVSDVEARLYAEPSRVDEVGIALTCRDQDDRRLTPAAWSATPRGGCLLALRVAPEAGGFDRFRDRLEQGVVAPSTDAFGAAVQVQPLLDLIPARVGNLVAQVSQLGQVAAEGSFRHPPALSELEGGQPRLGDDPGP